MFTCLCGKHSHRRETPLMILTEARIVNYPNGGNGWEIVRELPMALSHKHHVRFDQTFKRFAPHLGGVLVHS